MPGPLDGLLVADFSRVLAGPYATMLLGDLGATVVKVERPGDGDDTRAWGPPYAPSGQSTYFESVNRNKLSIALDLSDDADRATALRLADTADVLVENFKPGALRRFGLDADACLARNSRLVYCSISGFGSGAGAELPGYDLLVQAMGGLMSITGTSEPTKAGVALVDVLTGLHASVDILAALRHRDVTGQGQAIEVSLLSSLLSSLVNQAQGFVGAGAVPGPLGNAHPSIAPYEVYQAKDRPLVIAVGNDGQFRRLAEVLGDPGLATDTQFVTNADRVAGRAALKERIETLLAVRSADEWQDVLTAAGVPAGPINTIDRAFELAERLGLEPVQEGTVANPARLSATPVTYRLRPPAVDENREQVLGLLADRAGGR